MRKLIYLANRKPGFSDDDFVRRWRMHGARGMETAWWRHVQSYVQAEPIRRAMDGASEAYDAVASLIVNDNAFEQTAEDIAQSKMMALDELETFAAPTPPVSIWVDEERLKPGPMGGVTAFLFFKDASKARDVAGRYRTADALHRVTLNTRRNDYLGNAAQTLPFHAVVELAAISLAALKAALAGGVDADVLVITREAVLWDRLPA